MDQVDGQIPEATLEALSEETRQLQAALPGSIASAGGEAFDDQTPSFSIVRGPGGRVRPDRLAADAGLVAGGGDAPAQRRARGGDLGDHDRRRHGLDRRLLHHSDAGSDLGLAVGIDYALFITSRHRDQLRDGMEPEESAAQALATAGSAVVFAGLTVMIALVGLSVAGIPFLTTMGIAAAVAVAVAVLIALTLLPALLGFAGTKLRPKQRARRAGAQGTDRRTQGVGVPRRWVRIVTKWPVLTIAVVIVALGAMAYPAKDLRSPCRTRAGIPVLFRAASPTTGQRALRCGPTTRPADRFGR